MSRESISLQEMIDFVTGRCSPEDDAHIREKLRDSQSRETQLLKEIAIAAQMPSLPMFATSLLNDYANDILVEIVKANNRLNPSYQTIIVTIRGTVFLAQPKRRLKSEDYDRFFAELHHLIENEGCRSLTLDFCDELMLTSGDFCEKIIQLHISLETQTGRLILKGLDSRSRSTIAAYGSKKKCLIVFAKRRAKKDLPSPEE